MKDFHPATWLTGTHLQTLGTVIVPRAMSLFPSKNRLFALPDGSKLVAECSWQSEKATAPTLLIVHGINGSTISSYIRGVTAKAFARGFNIVRLNLRNGGNNERYSQPLMDAGQSADIQTVITELITQDGLPKIGLVAFSYGANSCFKALGEWGLDVPKQLFGAVGISPLIDLAACADSLDHRAPWLYRWLLLKGLKSSLRARNRFFPERYHFTDLDRIKTLRGYDTLCAPFYGFKSAEDYYAHSSARPFLAKIAVPTLLIQADDDRIVPVSSFAGVETDFLKVIITRGGGHGGFIARSKGADPDRHWAENRAIEYLLDLAG